MEREVSINKTNTVTKLNPCYEIDPFSYKLITTPSVVCVLLYGLVIFLSVVTVCGNLLVIISVFYFKQLHTPTNFLILSLAVTDLLVGIFVLPLNMTFSSRSCLYHEGLFCRVRDSFDVLLSTCSYMNLFCIAVDRYYAVCQPLTYKSKISFHVVVIMIVVIWVFSVLIGIGVIIHGMKNEQCEETCYIDSLMANTVGPIFTFFLPLLIMLCIYLKIFLVARRQARSIQTRMKCGATVSKMERKATKTLAIVLGVFLLCWTPFFLCITVLPFTQNIILAQLIDLLNWLTLSNSMMNPFIYAFFYSWFRSAFKLIITGKIFQGDFANVKLN